MTAAPLAPLILTATFDAAAAAYFQTLRQRHFPPHLNFIPAHLTLFHHLPGDACDETASVLTAIGQSQHVLPFTTAGPRKLGRGVAFAIQADGLKALQAGLATRWQAWLTPQDRQKFQPHVTVQNKVAPAAALALYEELTDGFQPLAGTITGLDLWHYRGGPWEHAMHAPFGA